jgi:hypothetical protein
MWVEAMLPALEQGRVFFATDCLQPTEEIVARASILSPSHHRRDETTRIPFNHKNLRGFISLA